MAPVLIEINGTALRESAAELTVPAGEFRIVRLIYTADVWGEEEPWDGSAALQLGVAWDIDGEGMMMRAFGFASSFDDRPISPYLNYYSIDGEGWSRSSTSSSCSGDGCDSVPEHEAAWLLGSLAADVTFRVGVLDGEGADTLWDRPAIQVRADANTMHVVAGSAYRAFILGTEYERASGDLTVERGGIALPTATGVLRTTHYSADFEAPEPGVLSVGLAGLEAAGLEQWSYAIDAPGMQASWNGPWAHATIYSIMLANSGVIWPPLMSAQGTVEPGPVSFVADREFTGQGDPTGLASLSYDGAEIGYAALDLEALYEWEITRTPIPDSGTAVCTETSFLPDLTICRGDPQALSQA